MKIFRGLNLIILGAVSLICLPFVGVGVYEGVSTYRSIKNNIRVEGTVINNRLVNTHDEGALTSAYFPEIEFFDKNNRKHIFTDGIGSFPADYAVGDKIEVIYSPENESDARIFSLKRLWLAPFIFVVVGFAPIAIFAIILTKLNL